MGKNYPNIIQQLVAIRFLLLMVVSRRDTRALWPVYMLFDTLCLERHNSMNSVLTIRSARSSANWTKVVLPPFRLALILSMISNIIGFLSWNPRVCMESTSSDIGISPANNDEENEKQTNASYACVCYFRIMYE